jgi:hypothetical protein
MKTVKLITLFAFLLTAINLHAQKLKFEVISGNLAFLKEVNKIKIIYDYSNLMVGELKESDYVAKRMAEKNLGKPGSGELWLKEWVGDRSDFYEPRFEEVWNKYIKKIPAGKNIESDVIMNVHTTWIEPGFYLMGSHADRTSLINITITFTKKGEEKAVVNIIHSPGVSGLIDSFDAANRIAESYAKAAKTLAQYILKNKMLPTN